MKLTFKIEFFTHFGQNIYVSGNIPELGNGNTNNALHLSLGKNGICSREITLRNSKIKNIKYKYFLKNKDSTIEWEWGVNRVIPVVNYSKIVMNDSWRSISKKSNIYATSIFVNVFHKRKAVSRLRDNPKINFSTLKFRFNAPIVAKNQHVGLVGNQKILGNWNPDKLVSLQDKNFPIWETSIPLHELTFPLEYKYVVVDSQTKNFLYWELGANRILNITKEEITGTDCIFQSDEYKAFPIHDWKGAGVSIPVFSLRTKNSFGIGDFMDIKLLATWAKKARLRMIQILPINDTISTYTFTDSYPYAAISVSALHPIYLSLERFLPFLNKKDYEEYSEWKHKLNSFEKIDYIKTLNQKLKFSKKIFNKCWNTLKTDHHYTSFFKKNKSWLQPYAAFCVLRDKYKTPDFSKWEIHASYTQKEVEKLTAKDSQHYSAICFYYFLQYYLHHQLKEAIEFTHKYEVTIKGDIPIGICKTSVEAWKDASLFYMDMQAGAPPDFFTNLGQNWGMPTYRWREMKKDNYLWWRKRFQNMANYFDAYRIDHILGFFRIWQIHNSHCWGIMGHFNPSLLYTKEELEHNGLWLSYDRMCKPYIREHILRHLFGDKTPEVKNTFLEHKVNDFYQLKEKFNTQNKIKQHFTNKTRLNADNEVIKRGLMQLCTEVIFIPFVENNEQKFHPRISFHDTFSYQELDWHIKAVLNKIYIDFYYHCHNEFWKKQAMEKLPMLIQSTNMLVCGEDLGMIPDCVPEVMHQLKILSLEIQRMPKNMKIEFSHPSDAPYLSVCTTSTHDMSTMRMWWEEDRAKSQRYYNNILGKTGAIPYFAEDWLCREIITQHLYSPPMWVIFPIQDLLAMDASIRWDKTMDERINLPSNPKHYWRYRMHISMEELLNNEEFTLMISNMVKESGRN